MGDMPADDAARGAGSPDARGDVRVVPLTGADLEFAVAQHLEHFPHGFFARLGGGFLREYYRCFLSSDGAVALLAVCDDEPVGYLAGTVDPAGHRRELLRRHGRTLAWRATVAMLLRPGLGVHFVRTRARRYLRRLLLSSAPAAEPPAGGARTAVLSHVAVTPEARSHGVGSALIAEFEARVAAAGVGRITLVTAAGPAGAGDFYLRQGWRIMGEHLTPDGQCLATFSRPVPWPGPDAPVPPSRHAS